MKLLIIGETGSGKTEFAKQYNGLESTSIRDLKSGKTIFIDNVERYSTKELTEIINLCKGDLILTSCKTVKGFTVKNMGSTDHRKQAFLKVYPNSAHTVSFDTDMRKILEVIYTEKDRSLVLEMLTEVKPNMFLLINWLNANGNIQIMKYIDEEMLFKNKECYIYSILAYGIEPKKRTIQFPKFYKICKT